MPIWKQRLFARLQSPADDGGDGGGGTATITPEVQALIDAAVNKEVTGLKTKNSDLVKRLSERDTRLKEFDGIDPNAVRNILKRFSDDEEAALLAKGEIDTVLNKRTERMKADYDKKLTDALTSAEQATKRAQAFQGRVLDDAIRAATAQSGIHKHAIDDALLHARNMFSLDENGNAVALGDDGKPVLGKDGKSPFAPLEWLESMKDKKPHWWPATASGGGAGSSGTLGAPSNKKAADMTTAEKASFIGANGFDKWQDKVRADYTK